MGQKAGSLFNSMESKCLDDGLVPPELDSQLLQTRQCLLSAIKLGSDCSGPLVDLLYLPCAVTMKYAVLNVGDILQNNNQSVQRLRNIPVALNILEKYGRHLIKPKSVRNELWRYVKFSNPIFRDRVDPLQGGRELMKEMGYTEEIEDGLFFPEPLEPDLEQTANMVADIILAKKEMEMYLSGTHPNPQAIEKFLSQDIVLDVQMMRIGVNMGELTTGSSPAQPVISTNQQAERLAMNQAVSQKQIFLKAQEVEQPTLKLCDICGDQAASMLCTSCDCKLLCASCDDMWHTHPRRLNHKRTSTSLMDSKVDHQQTDTIQGPYGIQARPIKESGHRMLQGVSPLSSVPRNSQSQSPQSPQVYRTEGASSSPGETMNNVPCLESLVQSSSNGLPPISLCSAPAPDSTCQPSSQTMSTPLHQVYFPPDNIAQLVSSPSMPMQSVTLHGSSIDRHNSQSITSKLITKIKEEPNLEKQVIKCDIHIITISEEIEDIEKQLNILIENNETFYEDEDFMKLNRKKGLLVRERIHLEKYRQEIQTKDSQEKQDVINTRMTVSSLESELPVSLHVVPSETTQHCAPYKKSEAMQHLSAVTSNNQVLDILSKRKPDSVSNQTPNMQQVFKNIDRYRNPVHKSFQSSQQLTPNAATQTYSSPAVSAASPTDLSSSMQTIDSRTEQLIAMKQEVSGSTTSKSELISTQPSGLGLMELHSVVKERSQCMGDSGHRRRWQCEHCTIFNNVGTRICEMCHKTSDHPVYVEDEVPQQPAGQQTKVQASALTNIGYKIAQEQDQVYLEKQEAHRLYQERLRKEAEGSFITETGCSSTQLQENINQLDKPNLCLNKSEQESSRPRHNVFPEKSCTINATETRSQEPASKSKQQASFQETMDTINEQRHVKKTQLDGSDMLQIVKAADASGYDIEEVLVALEYCERSALDWLKTSWEDLIRSVITVVKNRSLDYEQNNVGTLSAKEAKKALYEHCGNVEEAVASCINARIKLYTDINSDGSYAREDVLESMHEHEGDKELVQTHLDFKRLSPFLDRIWQTTDNGEADVLHLALNANCNSVSTSVISHQDFQARVRNKDIDLERRIRMVLVEARLQSWGRADTVIKILEHDMVCLEQENDYHYTLEDVVEAVRNCQDRRSSLVYLQRECIICMSKFPMTKMMNLNICQCQMCRNCLRRHFEISIKEKHVRNWTCPVCSLPDFNDETVSADYLNLLGLMLNTFVDKDIQDLFETKVRDWHLQKDPNFRWCAHCGNGFLYQGWQDGRHLAMTCQQCRNKTCFLCKKQWETQHEGLTCEQFEQWKIDNDPSNQAAGLAKHLEESGIDCPSCKMRYSLAKGGCMHFKCPECAHEFCSGCSQPFYKKGACSKLRECKTKGLHCHHPRDCFYYLRDNDIEQLQKLLQSGSVMYNTEAGQDALQTCPVMEQKDGEIGSRKDEACGKNINPGNAGLCRVHYKEYLVTLINRNKLDPVAIMNQEQMFILIERMELPKPDKHEGETQTQFKKRLSSYIKKKIPLQR